MTDSLKAYTATKSFMWDGKNVPAGGSVKLGEIDAAWMLGRGAVVAFAPKAKAKK